jgi:tRNA(fMet)-specific endonuclease VapC
MGQLSYLLDTNILSEATKPEPNAQVLEKLKAYNGHYATAVTVWHELHFGCERLPESKLKQRLQSYLAMLLQQSLDILPFTQQAAEWLAIERARLMKTGYSFGFADGEIASIAASNNLILVTRNTKDFERFSGLQLENWFEEIES